MLFRVKSKTLFSCMADPSLAAFFNCAFTKPPAMMMRTTANILYIRPNPFVYEKNFTSRSVKTFSSQPGVLVPLVQFPCSQFIVSPAETSQPLQVLSQQFLPPSPVLRLLPYGRESQRPCPPQCRCPPRSPRRDR